jgi:hemolysin activation/secretion protein
MKYRLSAFAFNLGLLVCWVLPSAAQIDTRIPNDLEPGNTKPIPVPQPVPLPKIPDFQPEALPRLDPKLLEGTPNNGILSVKEYRVEGSKLISPAELTAATKAYLGAAVPCSDLQKAANAITKIYLERGYITSGAIVPNGCSAPDGIVILSVKEGTVPATSINISHSKKGPRRLDSNYIRSRLAKAVSPVLNRTKLLDELLRLKRNPLIEDIKVEIRPGKNSGESVLEVLVTEAPTLSAQVLLDNARSPSVGSDRRQIQLTQANLTGLGDSLTVAYTNTLGSHAGDIRYTAPINPRNGTVSLNLSFGQSNIVESPFNVLDIQSSSSNYEISLRQPIEEYVNREFALGVSLNHRRTRSELLNDVAFPALGSDGEGRTRVTALRFFQDAQWRSDRSVLFLRSQLSLGLGLLATKNEVPPDGRFVSWQGQGQWVRLIGKDKLLSLRGELQVANRALVPIEQLGLGGVNTVRGYRQDVLLGDNGLLLSGELQIPVIRIPQWQSKISLIPFVDFGKAWNKREDLRLDPDTLASVGLGLQWQVSDRFRARLDWGVPLLEISGQKRTWQENGVHFSLTYRQPF